MRWGSFIQKWIDGSARVKMLFRNDSRIPSGLRRVGIDGRLIGTIQQFGGPPLASHWRPTDQAVRNLAVSKLRVQSFAISIDGYGAGPNQDLQHPLGVRGPELMDWFFQTRAWRRMHGQDDGETGVD